MHPLFRDRLTSLDRFNPDHRKSIDNGGEPPDDGNMEARVAKLETIAEKTVERLTGLERNAAIILSNYATKEDLHKEINAQTWKLVTFVCGFGTALVGAVYFIATHMK